MPPTCTWDWLEIFRSKVGFSTTYEAPAGAREDDPFFHNESIDDDNYSSDTSSEAPELDDKMVVIERKVKVVTEQHNIDKPAQMEGYPMKEWTIEIYLLDQEGKEHPANCFTKVTYNLHPSFANPVQTFTEAPFRCTNEGWGEFEMTIDMYTTEKGGKTTIPHDLNFLQATYENIHKVNFKNPSMALQAVLRETGPVPTDEERKSKKCEEDDLLQIIQMIHDGKTEGTFISNNVDGNAALSRLRVYRALSLAEERPGRDVVAGEFSVDLYTLPDDTLVQLWELLGRLGHLN
ncbi:yeats family-domain-containing protein [Coniochaeta sp. 2T2.1]|nr:yeats family-domain-containing protein [Coniochaeta sp. 2T2.1]